MLTVAVRFRPETHSPQNIHKNAESKLDDGDSVDHIEVFEEPQNFIRINNEFNLYFDTVLGSNSFQSDVFSKIIRCKANDFLNGINCSILTYGAKSTGKSYTMFGKLNDRNAVSHLGIVPRTISYLIEKLQCNYSKSRVKKDHIEWNLFISFGCVYSETICDLINSENNKHIHLKRNKKTNEYYLKNLTQIKIKKLSSFLKHMHIAEAHRKKYHAQQEGVCHMFAVIKLNVYSLKSGSERSKLSSTVLNFIDCAAYSSIDNEGAASNINFSFIQLNALMTRIAKKNDLAIDVRESILTKLLYPIRQTKHKPGGKLLVLICSKLERELAAETMATLRFGNLPTIDPFILGMMEKQRKKMKKLEAKSREYKMKYKEYKMKSSQTPSVAIESVVVDEREEEIAQLTRNIMEIENKYELLQSEYELIKLDYVENKKELNTQKNHNFWLMEDFNELKLKLTQLRRDDGGDDDSEKMSQLRKEMRRLREEKSSFDKKIVGYEMELNEYENEMTELVEKHENELNELMVGIRERDEEIRDLRKELEGKEEENIHQNKMMKADREMYEKYISELEENALDNEAINGTNCEHKDGEEEEEEDLIKKKDAEIRQLKMEIIKYKTDISSSLLVEKLRNKKRKLEEKVINLRTDKAKQIVAHNQELHAQDERIQQLQRRMHNMNAIRKWTKLVHKRRLVAASENMHRANKKMKQNYTQNSEFRDQMFLLRKIAEKKFENCQETGNYEELAIETSSDFEKEMIGLLPTNLKRIHRVIDKLSNKLMIKNVEIQQLKKEKDIDDDEEDILDNIYSPSEDPQNLLDGDDFLPSSCTKIRDAYSSTNDSKAMTIEQFDNEELVDIAEEDSIATKDKNYDEKNDEFQLKQKQLRLLQESALSVAFHLDNAKNTRIKLNVAMTPCEIYKEMCDIDGDVDKEFSLIIQHNICPDYERIVIPSNCMRMSFWQLIVEFGILNLLHFNICCDESAQKYLLQNASEYSPKIKVAAPQNKSSKNRKRKDSKRGSGIWNMFAKK